MADSGNFLTQDELDALLGAISGGGDKPQAESAIPAGGSAKLTPEELDMIGEVGNIIMGSAATALFTIIGKEVQITKRSKKRKKKPRLSLTTSGVR